MILPRLLKELREALPPALKSAAQDAGLSLGALEFSLPPAQVHADLSLTWALPLAKAFRRPPMDIGKEILAAVKNIPEIESGEVLPPGFVNLKLKLPALGENLDALLKDPASYGKDPEEPKDAVLIEFVSANPTGPLHLASGRGATLGDSLVKILRRRGRRVAAEYYINDSGNQINKLGVSLKARRLGQEPPEDGYHGDYVIDLAKSFPAEADQWPPEKFAQEGLSALLKTHQRDMEVFGVHFDRWYRESELHQKGALQKVLAILKERGMVYEKEGAIWLGTESVEEAEDDKDRVLIKSGGLPTYFLADAAYHEDKYSRGYGELIDILGADHHGYVQRLKAVASALGHSPDSLQVIIHQLVHLYRNGQAVRMSKRAGEFVTLKELVDEVGRDACRFFFALRAPQTHLHFDIELAKKQTSENPVFYCQYVPARISSIFREAQSRGLEFKASSPIRADLLTAPEERALLVKIAWLWEVLRACERELSPHPLANYLIELARLFHAFYEKCRVADPDNKDLSQARLHLIAGVRQAMAEGLSLLGVSVPEKM